MSLPAWWHGLASEAAHPFRYERAWSIALRTAHLIAVSLMVGGYVWGVSPARLRTPLLLVCLTGMGLAGLELRKSPHWLFQGKGLVILVKLSLLAWLPMAGDRTQALLLVVMVLASVGAHMPSRYRHYSVLLRRVVSAPPSPLAGAGPGEAVADVGRHEVASCVVPETRIVQVGSAPSHRSSP